MSACLVVYASLNQVKHVKRVLEKDGRYYEMLRSPHCISPGGCSFAIRAEPERLSAVLQASQQLSITPQGIWHEQEKEGSLRYESCDPHAS